MGFREAPRLGHRMAGRAAYSARGAASRHPKHVDNNASARASVWISNIRKARLWWEPSQHSSEKSVRTIIPCWCRLRRRFPVAPRASCAYAFGGSQCLCSKNVPLSSQHGLLARLGVVGGECHTLQRQAFCFPGSQEPGRGGVSAGQHS